MGMRGRKRREAEGKGGELCPKCVRIMTRREHGPNWKPKSRQPYYFAYWDVCTRCRHVQHYAVAKVVLPQESGIEQCMEPSSICAIIRPVSEGTDA